ncbi:MAG: thiamine phosphate synthase, partial [Pseudomonadota bacterium]
GIIFRHYHLDAEARRARFTVVRHLARKNRHLLLLADRAELARRWGADGIHGRQWLSARNSGLVQSAPVHDRREIADANRNRADLFFLSSVFPTSSHPGAPALPHMQTRRLAALCDGPVILLGGMSAARFLQMRHVGAHGWAAIDALM